MAKPHVLMTPKEQTEEQRRRAPGGHKARKQLLAAMPVTERRLQLAGVSTAVLEGGDDPLIEQPDTLLRALRTALALDQHLSSGEMTMHSMYTISDPAMNRQPRASVVENDTKRLSPLV